VAEQGVNLTELEEAERGIFAGAIIATLLGFLTLMIGGMKILMALGQDKIIDWYLLVDPMIFFAVATAIYFKSRIGALVSFGFFLAKFGWLILYIGSVRQVIFAALVLGLFVYGVWGVFKWHRIKSSRPDAEVFK
jgi:hypothetical protein